MLLLDDNMQAELEKRLKILRSRPYSALSALALETYDKALISGITVYFTTLRFGEPDGKIEIRVRVDKKIFFGFWVKGYTKGFSMLPDGRTDDSYYSCGIGFFRYS